MPKEKELVKVQGLPAKKGKPQHLDVGMVYEVTPDTAEIMIKNGTAVKTSLPVGKVGELPKGVAKKENPLD